MVVSATVWLFTICVAVCSGYTFNKEYLTAEPDKLLNHLKTRGFYPGKADDTENEVVNRSPSTDDWAILNDIRSRGNQEEKETDSPVKRADDANIVPEELVDFVCKKLVLLLGDSVVDCSNAFLMTDLSELTEDDRMMVANVILNLTQTTLIEMGEEGNAECLKSLVSLGSLYYLTTEELFLGIYLTFYSELMRTMLNSPIPTPEMYKVEHAALTLVEEFWWRVLQPFLDDMQEAFGITIDEYAHEITNSPQTMGKDVLSSYFPEEYFSVRKVLVGQVLHAAKVLATYKQVLTLGGKDCTGLGEIYVTRLKLLDVQLNASLSAILYNKTQMTTVLHYAMGDVPYLAGASSIVDRFQAALQTAGLGVLQTAATVLAPMKDLDTLDEVASKSLEIFLGFVARSIKLWNTVGGVLYRMHTSLGSTSMNTNFYNTPTTDMSRIVITLVQELEAFADISLSKKMVDILTGLVELKRMDFSMMNPVLWPSGSRLKALIAEQNQVTYSEQQATALVDQVFSQIFVDNLNAAKAGTVAETASHMVSLPLSILGLFNIIKPQDMNEVAALFTMIALPLFEETTTGANTCEVPRVTPPEMAGMLRTFTIGFEAAFDDNLPSKFSDVADTVGKSWVVNGFNLLDLTKVGVPTVFEELRTAVMILETFDSNNDASTVVGSVLASELHNLLWTIATRRE